MMFFKANKETSADLYRMALDPTYWGHLEDLANHPASWPEFSQWVATAQNIGPELAGEPPQPPEQRRSLWPFNKGQSTHPFQQDDTEKPARELRGILHGLVKPVVFLVLSIVLMSTGYFIYTFSSNRFHNTQTVQQTSARQHVETDSIKKAQADARLLLNKVAASPVALDKALEEPTKNLNQALKSRNLTTVKDKQAQLEQTWNGLMSIKVENTQLELTNLLTQIQGLSNAPDSASKIAMDDLATIWGQKKVTITTLDDAIKAANQMHDLIDVVKKDQAQAIQVQAEEEARNHFQSPSEPPVVLPQYTQPQRTQGNNNAPPTSGGAGQGGGLPSWSVPAPSQEEGLPGRDGSL